MRPNWTLHWEFAFREAFARLNAVHGLKLPKLAIDRLAVAAVMTASTEMAKQDELVRKAMWQLKE